MEITAPGKLLALCIVLSGSLAFIVASMFVESAPDTTPAWATITLVTGYLIGNGTGARKGIITVPPFAPSQTQVLEPEPEL